MFISNWIFRSVLIIATLSSVFVSCNNPPPPPTTNNNPVAAFTAAAPTIKAGDPLLFTSSSSDPDGDALTQSWDFGDDTRGGGLSIAHVFPSAGAFIVKLTVGDGKGGVDSTTQSITVTAGEPTGAPLAVSGEITDTAGLPLAGVAVKLGSSTLGTSDANGKVIVSIPTGPSQTLMLFKAGYTDQVAALEFPIGSSSGNAFFKLSMMTQAPSQPMSATTGGAITGLDNAKLEIPAAALETANGTPVTGNIEVSITPLDVSNPAILAAMPGRLEGTQTDGSSAGIVSLGMTDFSLTQNGQDLNLKPGSSAKVRIPLYADTDAQGKVLVLGDTIPLWSMSEKTGEWVQEGIGIVVDNGNGTKALEATITHFSLWNCDHIYDENKEPDPPVPPLEDLPKIKPKCKIPPELAAQYDTDFKKLLYCKFLAEMVDIFGDQGANQVRTQAVPIRQPAWRSQGDLLVTGTETAPVPPNRKIRYTACVVLSGTKLCGSEVKTLQRGTTTEFDVFMSPVQIENVIVPLNITRNFSSSQRQFVFDVANSTELAFRLERINGSTLNAQVELYKQVISLGTRIFSSEINQIAVNTARAIPSGKYILIVTPSGGSTGDLRIQIEPAAIEALSLPFDGVRSILKKQQYTFNFNSVPSSLSLLFERSAGSNLNATIKLLDPNSIEIPIGDVGVNPLVVDKIVQSAGQYILEVTPNNSTGDLRIKMQATTESLTLPFDAVRPISVIRRYEFDSATSPNGISVLVERGAGSSFSGTTTLFNPSGTVMASGAVGATTQSFDVQLTATGKHILEVKPTIGSSGNVRIKIVRKDIANTIAFDTDLDVPQVANRVDTYSFNATQGQQISLGFAWSQGAAYSSSYPIVRKPGNPNPIYPFSGIYTLQTAGEYQIVVTNGATATGMYRLRLNTVQALIALNTIDPLTTITTSLNLGEVRRYVLTPALTLGEVIALRLESNSVNAATNAYLRGFPQSGLIGNNGISIASGKAPQSKLSEITFIPIATDTYWLYLDGSGNQNFNTIGQIGGQFTLGIFRPSAPVIALDSSVSGSINTNTLLTYRVNVPTAGSYLLRSTIAAGNTVTAEIWNSDIPRIANNIYFSDRSEFLTALSTTAEEIKGGLKAGNHTITIHNKKIDTTNPINTPTNYNVSLVTLENPTDLTIGAAAVNGLIDVPGERDYYRFNATVGQAFTITATSPAFTGTIRIHKLSTTKDFTTFETFNIFGGNPTKALGTHSFTIPNVSYGGTGTYIIEIDAAGTQIGAYSLALTSP